jgi:hypothetical protein
VDENSIPRMRIIIVSSYLMVIVRYYIIVIAGLFLLTRCGDEKEPNATLPSSFLPQLSRNKNSLAGEWEYSNSIYYSAKLRLKSDGTFNYHNETCYGQSFTEGKWRENNGAIVLTSNDNYRPFKEAKPQLKPKETRFKEGQLTFIGFDETDGRIIPGSNDTVRVYFNNVLLKLITDTLYSGVNNTYIAEHKFTRMVNNR